MNKIKLNLIKVSIGFLMVTLSFFLIFTKTEAMVRKPIPRVTLKLTRLDFSNGYWNYQTDWTLQNLNSGSIKVNGHIFVDGITQSGTDYTGYSLKPKKSYTFIYYSKNGGRGSILARKTVVPPRGTQVVSTPTPSHVPSPTISSAVGNNKNLNWLIVFTNTTGEQLPNNIKNDLCNGAGQNRFSHLPTWFAREAIKYGITLSISLSCYSQQIQLPQNVQDNPDHYTGFGQQIPIPLNMRKTSDFILQTIPSSQNYDLITVIDYRTSGDMIADMANLGKKVSFVFITKAQIIDGVQYYGPNITSPNIEADPTLVKGIAHEALHSLGAFDHYNYSTTVCETGINDLIYGRSPRIMCADNLNQLEQYVIPPETAKEIGWIN